MASQIQRRFLGLLQAWSEPYTQVGHALFAPAGTFDGRHLFTDIGDFLHKFTEWPGGGVIPLPACGESFIPGGSLGMTNIASMVSHTALRALTGNIATASWVSSIYRPEDVPSLEANTMGPNCQRGRSNSYSSADGRNIRMKRYDGYRLALEMGGGGFRAIGVASCRGHLG
jgi:hypothetical protein